MDSERIPPGRPPTSVPSLTHSGDLVGDTGKLDNHEQLARTPFVTSQRHCNTTLRAVFGLSQPPPGK